SSKVGDSWFIGPPPDRLILESRLTEFGFADYDVVRSFMLYFGGIREDVPYLAGSFPSVEEWEIFGGDGTGMEYVRESCRNYGAWEGAVRFYESRNGDQLILHPSGRLGWWSHETDEIHELLKSFDDFPAYYCDYIARRYPFSSWEPSPDEIV